MVHIQQVKNRDSWEMANCPPEVYDELDDRGLLPDVGVVSSPFCTAIIKDQIPEIIECLKEMGIPFKNDFTG